MNNTPLKQWNQTITITVEVDAVAHKLLEALNPEFTNKAGLVDAIISNCIERGGISFIYNALMGFSNDIAIQVGQILSCEETIRPYVNVAPEGDEQPVWKNDKWLPIGKCTVLEVNPFAEREVKVAYTFTGKDGQLVQDTQWVRKNQLKELTPEIVGMINQPM